MTDDLGVAEAEALLARHLGTSPRADHSRFVGAVMGEFARRLETDEGLWHVVGLVHDIDYFEVAGDFSRHGVVAAGWLAERLPEAALTAIAAHDHRTGVMADGALADALRLADALAVFDQRVGRRALLAAASLAGWQQLAGEQQHLFEMISRLSARLGVEFEAMQAITRALPDQRGGG